MDWTTSLRALGSIFFLIGILALASDNRKRIPWALVAKGMLIQFVFAFLILRVSFVEQGFQAVGQVFVNILGYTREGSLFLFGSLISNTDSFGYIFAFQVLPTVIFFSAFTSLVALLSSSSHSRAISTILGEECEEKCKGRTSIRLTNCDKKRSTFT